MALARTQTTLDIKMAKGPTLSHPKLHMSTEPLKEQPNGAIVRKYPSKEMEMSAKGLESLPDGVAQIQDVQQLPDTWVLQTFIVTSAFCMGSWPSLRL